jgi:hypothetical protein
MGYVQSITRNDRFLRDSTRTRAGSPQAPAGRVQRFPPVARPSARASMLGWDALAPSVLVLIW